MSDQSDDNVTGLPYAWTCLACESGNAKDATLCSACGCPARATLRDIEQFRPGDPQAREILLRQDEVHHSASRDALIASKYRWWYWASVSAYLLTLLSPHGIGLYMVFTGWLALRYSWSWFANPLLILVFVLARPTREPGSWRWFAYSALALMFVQPFDSIERLWPLPFLPWLASAVLLVVGIERYRAKYRQALAKRRGKKN